MDLLAFIAKLSTGLQLPAIVDSEVQQVVDPVTEFLLPMQVTWMEFLVADCDLVPGPPTAATCNPTEGSCVFPDLTIN